MKIIIAGIAAVLLTTIVSPAHAATYALWVKKNGEFVRYQGGFGSWAECNKFRYRDDIFKYLRSEGLSHTCRED